MIAPIPVGKADDLAAAKASTPKIVQTGDITMTTRTWRLFYDSTASRFEHG
jgi:hypothetical protein